MHRTLFKYFNNGINSHVEDLCPFVPSATKEKLERIRIQSIFRGETSFWEDFGYWCALAKDDGVVDTSEGLRFKTSLMITKNGNIGYSQHKTKHLPYSVHQNGTAPPGAVPVNFSSPSAAKAPPVNISNSRKSRVFWTQEEDQLLLKAIGAQSDHFSWSTIARDFPRRTGKHCRERYLNHLKYNLKQSAWTTSEDATIFRLFESEGSKWSAMTQFLPGRTDNGIKNRYHHLKKLNEKSVRSCQTPKPANMRVNDKSEQPTQSSIQHSTLLRALKNVHPTTQKEKKSLKRRRCNQNEQRLDLSDERASKKENSVAEHALTATATKQYNGRYHSIQVKPTPLQIEEACTQRQQGALFTWFRRLQDFIDYKVRNGHGKFFFLSPLLLLAG